MNPLSLLRVALAALLVNKGRSSLTSLGIVIGIAAVIALVSAGEGARRKLDDRLDSVGKNLIIVRPGARTQQGLIADSAPLTGADADAIRRQVGDRVVGVAQIQITQRLLSTDAATAGSSVVGATPEVQQVRQWRLRSGRFITDEDVRSQAAVCLLGETVRRRLFGAAQDPVGETLRVDRLQMRVVGVLAEKGRSPTGADQDDQIFVPLTTLQRKLVGGERLTAIITAVRSEADVDRVKGEIQQVLRDRHHLQPGSEAFDVSSVRELAELAVVVSSTLEYLVAAIASISLLVGGIGIMNIMLVSVTERTREIGLRMAVGATPAVVLTQFLLEAVLLALAGGLLGVGLGVGAAVVLARIAEWPVTISPLTVLLACGVSASAGVFFGFYPAWKASRLDPIEALRYE